MDEDEFPDHYLPPIGAAMLAVGLAAIWSWRAGTIHPLVAATVGAPLTAGGIAVIVDSRSPSA